MSSLRVTELNIYPVKSCGGIGLTDMTVSHWGPEWDRRIMVVDEHHSFVTARKYPRLLQVKTALTHDGLRLSVKGKTDLHIDLKEVGSNEQANPDAKVWRDQVGALSAGASADLWFSSLLGTSVKLVYMPDTSFRQVDRRYFDQKQRVSFADGFPLLLTHQSSLDELNQRLQIPLPMTRFRPNIVVAGGKPWAEDNWQNIRIGGMDFLAVKPCSRCVMTTIDPTTLASSPEPLRTLKEYRRTDLGIIFGQNLVNLENGMIAVGDKVEVQ